MLSSVSPSRESPNMGVILKTPSAEPKGGEFNVEGTCSNHARGCGMRTEKRSLVFYAAIIDT